MTNMTDDIQFYREFEVPYGCFSNFFESPVAIGNITWPTTEHYFQAMKFEHVPKLFTDIQKASSPALAKKLGGTRTFPMRTDWESIKNDVMYNAVLAKFTQHKNLQQILLQTGNKKLIEHTGRDKYWGDGGDGSGLNMLGKTLMQVREQIRNDLHAHNLANNANNATNTQTSKATMSQILKPFTAKN